MIMSGAPFIKPLGIFLRGAELVIDLAEITGMFGRFAPAIFNPQENIIHHPVISTKHRGKTSHKSAVGKMIGCITAEDLARPNHTSNQSVHKSRTLRMIIHCEVGQHDVIIHQARAMGNFNHEITIVVVE